jgi:hypothetical protein
MKATDLNFAKDLKFDLETGITSFHQSRLVIFDVNAIGLLRQTTIKALGWEKARETFLKMGFQNGYADFMQIKLAYRFDNEMDLLASGPVVHTWEGIVKATPKELKMDRKTGEFLFTGVWTNSYEAEQHLCFNKAAAEPVCWSLTGYASGWASAYWGSKLIAMEPFCVGKGDSRCEWKIQPESVWGKEAAAYIEALKEFKVEKGG